MHRLEEIEAIRQLKYRYFRLLDTKKWDEIGDIFTDDATTSYDDGAYAQEGRDEIVEFLSTVLGSPDAITMHHGHHPEIHLTGDESATGIWYLEDVVMNPRFDAVLHGGAFYSDEYVKVDGVWKISHTGYSRTFEEHRKLSDTPSLEVHGLLGSAADQ